MQMRTWVLQPGTIITNGAAVRYAAITALGALALGATLLAMVYTTASDALGKLCHCISAWKGFDDITTA